MMLIVKSFAEVLRVILRTVLIVLYCRIGLGGVVSMLLVVFIFMWFLLVNVVVIVVV